MISTEPEIRALLASRCEAMRARNIDRLMTLYSPDIVYFDLVPPLRYTGSLALRERFLDWFGRWQSAIGQELQEVAIVANEDVAAAHMLIRASGMLKEGREVGYWVRTSNICERVEQRWVITHEHVSLPVDMQTGQAVRDLVP